MKNKAQVNIGWFLVAAVSILVGLVLINPIANTIVGSTTSSSLSNATYTASTTDVALTGYQDVIGTYILTNASSGLSIPTSNATLTSSATTGNLVLYLHLIDSRWNGKTINVTASVEPTGYIKDSAGRSVTLLIIIMSVIALVIFSIPNIKEYLDF